MTRQIVPKIVAGRLALVGDAAHVFPPLGAQGLNLGLRDVQAIIACAVEAREAGRDIGGPETLSAYERSRRSDIVLRTGMVDGLNRALLAHFAPADFARGAALAALTAIGPLRRLVMRGGIAPRSAGRSRNLNSLRVDGVPARSVQHGSRDPHPIRFQEKPNMSSTTADAAVSSETVAAGDREERRVSLFTLCFLALGVGIFTGVGAVALRSLIGLIHNLMFNGVFKIAYDANILEGPSRFGNWVILSPILGGLVVVYLVERFAPEAKVMASPR